MAVHGRGGIGKLVPTLQRLSENFDPNNMSPELSEVVYKIIAKESTAEHSYNGFVNAVAYGYSLKNAVQSHFNHRMTTYEECLRGQADMGQLTGAEVAEYGGEDAYWVLPLFRHLMSYMAEDFLTPSIRSSWVLSPKSQVIKPPRRPSYRHAP